MREVMVYVYRKHNNHMFFDDEIVKLFPDVDTAKQELENDVMLSYGRTLSEMKSDPEFKYDTVTDTFVEVENDDESQSCFAVEEHSMLLPNGKTLNVIEY